ncbi:MAG: hypothetical protein EOR99_25665 [Mesorhizobium sp.]|nr:MAG: hypothetical protein EOR99_25665 [Mesorhizobium sp.]
MPLDRIDIAIPRVIAEGWADVLIRALRRRATLAEPLSKHPAVESVLFWDCSTQAMVRRRQISR